MYSKYESLSSLDRSKLLQYFIFIYCNLFNLFIIIQLFVNLIKTLWIIFRVSTIRFSSTFNSCHLNFLPFYVSTFLLCYFVGFFSLRHQLLCVTSSTQIFSVMWSCLDKKKKRISMSIYKSVFVGELKYQPILVFELLNLVQIYEFFVLFTV